MCILFFLEYFSRNEITFYFNLRNSHDLRTMRPGIMRGESAQFSVSDCEEITVRTACKQWP